MNKIKINSGSYFNFSSVNWITYSVQIPFFKFEWEKLGEFQEFAVDRLNESEIKQKLCSKLEKVYLNHQLTFSEHPSVSVLDTEYFMDNHCIGKNKGLIYSPNNPNITISNIRSKSLKGLISPVSIFPNNYKNPGEDTRISVLNSLIGEIKSNEIILFARWSEDISGEIFTKVMSEYKTTLNEFMLKPKIKL
ncbi:MAG: hypothetical protein AABW81_03025 [Nanoarchaeota archaeon]